VDQLRYQLSKSGWPKAVTEGEISKSNVTVVPIADLPNPELLPAAYLKRCADYWLDLVEGGSNPKRIA
jgi:hypothetical protein